MYNIFVHVITCTKLQLVHDIYTPVQCIYQLIFVQMKIKKENHPIFPPFLMESKNTPTHTHEN